MKFRNFINLAAVAVILVGLAGCGGPEAEPEGDAAAGLEDRVLTRWGHMIERDFNPAWDYYTPGFRQAHRREDFARDMKRRPVRWSHADLIEMECSEDVCTARLDITYRAAGAPSGQGRMDITSRIEERWIRIDGQWWYVDN